MIALDPDDVLGVVLDSDLDSPEATRPVVLVKAMTCRRERKYRPLIKAAAEADKAGDLDGAIGKLIEAVGSVWVGTRNIGKTPTLSAPDELEDYLTLDELWQVANKCWEVSSLTAKKGVASSSPSVLPPGSTAGAGAMPKSAEVAAQVQNSPSASA